MCPVDTQCSLPPTLSLSSMDNISEEGSVKSSPFPKQKSLRRRGSFKNLRRKSEEFFKRRSPTCIAGIDNDRTIYGSLRHRAKSQSLSRHASSLNFTSSDDDSPFVTRKWTSLEKSGAPFASYSCNALSSRMRQDDYCYKLLLQSVVNPLGAPDTRPGFRPMDMAEYARQLFKISPEDHETRIYEVQQTRPSNVVLNVTVVEAKGIKPIGCTSLSDPYCLLGVQKGKSPIASPKNSPKSSPHSSPATPRRGAGMRSPAVEESGVRSTRTIKSTLYPKWSEEFELDVTSLHNEELHLSIWDESFKCHDEDSLVQKEGKSLGIKGFFKHFRNHVDCKISGGLIGHCRVPVKSVPASGCDKMFELYMDKKRKIKGFGQVRLKLQLSVKQDVDQLDGVESDQCSIENYHHIVQKVLSHHVSSSLTGNNDESGLASTPTLELTSDGTPILSSLSEQWHAVLNQFAVQNHFSKVTQRLMELVVILEMCVSNSRVCKISERLLKDAIADLEREWLQASGTDSDIDDRDLKHDILTDTETSLFENAVSKFIRFVVAELNRHQTQLIPPLFPPCKIDLEGLANNIQVATSLVKVHLKISQGDESCQKELASIFVQRLQEDTRAWLKEELSKVQSHAKDPAIPKTKLFVQVLQDALHIATPIYSVSQYFSRLGIDYFKLVSLALEKRLSAEAKDLMLQIDNYQIAYHRYPVNIRESSAASLQLYMALKTFFQTIRSNLSDRELFRVSMTNYQNWFQTAVTFWLQTFREECIRRMSKALEIEKDVVQVTSLVKYSNSSVDILSCFSKITTEWRQIDFNDADIASLGVTKITDTICDGVKWYVEKVMVILENNGYYDYNDNQQFDVTDQVSEYDPFQQTQIEFYLCITINNICHIRDYLVNLPNLLCWGDVTERLAIKHEDEGVGRQALRTLHNLMACAREDATLRCNTLLQRITDLIAVDLNNYTLMFTQNNPGTSSSVDPILDYLESNLRVLFEKLETKIFQKFLEDIWRSEIAIFDSSLLKGQSPSYYKSMLSNLGSMRAYFNQGGVDPVQTDCERYCELSEYLKLNSMSSMDLMLSYYGDLTSEVSTPTTCFGHIMIKTGFKRGTSEDNEGPVSIYVKVSQAKQLPGMTRKNLSDPFVVVRLCPLAFFTPTHSQRTDVHHATVDPIFNHSFVFNNIPSPLLRTKGAVISFTVWHHDPILPNDFLGEVLLPLEDVTEINPVQTIEDMPAVMMPLKRPPEPVTGPFQVLKERAANNERSAQVLVDRRQINAGYKTPYRCCAPVSFFMSKVIGKKSCVIGHVNGPTGVTESS